MKYMIVQGIFMLLSFALGYLFASRNLTSDTPILHGVKEQIFGDLPDIISPYEEAKSQKKVYIEV